MIRIGIVSEQHYVISGRARECESFTISPITSTFRQIFHSAFATPARYILEIFRRLRIIGKGRGESLFVFNPIFQLGRLEIWLVLNELAMEESFNTITIIADLNGRPLGYGFPAELADIDSDCLMLLSTVDAELDAQLCESLFSLAIRRITMGSLALARAQHNGFIYEENLPIYRWVAAQALAARRTGSQSRPQDLPYAAIMPHHAGDVLFFALAWQFTTTLIKSVAVNRAYQAIVTDCAADLASLPLDIPLINRSEEFSLGKVMTEGEYFPALVPALPAGHLYLYLRPSRDYNISRFHLIDHFAFALGRHFWNADDLLTQRHPLPQPLLHGAPPDRQVRILLFFDGGWPLKIYPRPMQQELINLLHQRGYTVTVLAGAGQDYRHCTVTRFEDYAQLKALLSSQFLMVGMDSFPTHLAVHVLGIPTLCLFGSTRPENSNAPVAPHYRHMENGLNCRPCYGIVKCPLYGGGECANFVAPEIVVKAIGQMLRVVEAAPSMSTAGPTRYEDSQPSLEEDSRPIRRLDFDHRAIKSPLYSLAVRLTPSFGFLCQIHAEFMISLRRDGWRQTYLRTLRYMQRLLRSRFSG